MEQNNPILCPYCGAEMRCIGPWEKYEPDMGGRVWLCRYKCPTCGSIAPEHSAPTCGEAKSAAYAAAQRRYVPPIKPMTWNELKERKDDSVWVETKETEEDECAAALVTYVESEYVHFRDIYRYFYMTREEMGKVWRCWLRRPTDEERMAAAWEVE